MNTAPENGLARKVHFLKDAAAVLSLVETFCPASRIRIKPDSVWKKSCKK
ncbi:MAG: hypothetical protein ACYDGU_12925 [Acidiferrobacterales bacterium]